MIGSLAINSNGAAALRVGIRIQSIPDSAEVRFFSDNATEVQLVSGKTIMDLIKQNLAAGDPEETARVYWSPVIQGEIAGVEVFIPDGVKPDEVQISIPQVSHLTVSPQSGGLNQQLGNPGDSAACELDAMCYPDWQTTGNSVARIIMTIGGSTGYCTGTLLNDKNGSLIPYFLTANHCISDQTTANSLQAYWFYHSTACNSGTLYSGMQVTGSGASLLYYSSTTDVSFLRLNSQPPLGVTFSGWSSNQSQIGQATTGLHNPMGDMQKLSAGAINGFTKCTAGTGTSINCSQSDLTSGTFLEVLFSKGITESGSSGSGLFLGSNKYLIGQLYGGGNSCTNPTAPSYYGRFDQSYTNGNLSQWLNPTDYSVDIFPYIYNYGSVTTGSKNNKDFTITNNGKYPVTFNANRSSPEAYGDGFYVSSTSCAVGLQVGQSCIVTVNFQPPIQGAYGEWLVADINESTTRYHSIYSGSATGSPVKYSATVSKIGKGTITKDPEINCGPTCSGDFNASSLIYLGWSEAPGYRFNGFSGDCSGPSCTLRMTSPKNVVATFKPFLSFYAQTGGSITTIPAGQSCGSGCLMFDEGTSVTVNAKPDAGYTFSGWSGDCSGQGQCTLNLSNIPSAKSVEASFSTAAPSTSLLSIFNAGNGTITSSPSGINCGSICSASFNSGTTVTLTATPNTGYTFTGWTGACSGTGACVVTMNSNQSVSASFSSAAPNTYLLFFQNSGNGLVTSSPSGINCGSTCSASFNSGTSVTLTATPNTGYTFTGWYGACSGTGVCILKMDSYNSASALFTQLAPSTYTLDVFNSGNGTITSSPSGINCGSTCSASFNSGTTVTLTATPNSGYTFTGWSGACSGVGACILTIDSYKSVSATFSQSLPSNYQLSVVNSGNGNVISSPSGISCGFLCNYAFSSGATVTLTANPDSGYTFSGWSGACSGVGACTVTMSAAQSVSASFTQNQKKTLSINMTGNGSGSVQGMLTISCSLSGGVTTDGGKIVSGPCTYQNLAGVVITLTATPFLPGSTFAGWSGACSGTGSCVVSLNSDLSVTANFVSSGPSSYLLSVFNSGNGTVSSSPAGINCGSTCTGSFNAGTSVTLSATPNSGYTFTGWNGACSGTGNCVVTMNATQNVIATFTALPLLSVTKLGNGTITSSPGGINCGPTCSFAYPRGFSLSLTATPDNGYIFSGWSGACTGSGICSVTMASNQNVTATFTAIPLLSVTKVGNGTITSNPSGINCGPTCSFAYTQGSSVSLAATPDSGYTFSGWSGACTGTAACNVTMSAAQTVTATFTALPNVFSKITVTRPTLGVIASDVAKINCGIKAVACSNSLQQGTVITLTAAPKAGYYTKGWLGCTSSSGDSCVLTIGGAPMGVSASFAPTPKFTLKVTKNKLGTVTSDPAGINCMANVTSCSTKIFSGTKVTLTATPSAGRTFVGWTGACSGKDVCSLTMDGTKGVSAMFQ